MIYEDALLKVLLPERGAIEGHIRLKIKKEIKTLDELTADEIDHIFKVSSFAATALFEGLGAKGTNIIVNNGVDGIVDFNIVPRFDDDGLDFQWEMKQESPEKLEEISKKLKSHTQFAGNEVNVEKPTREPEEPTEESDEDSEGVDYRIRQLNRWA